MKKLSVFLAGLLLAGLTIVQAQTVRITGTVTSSEDGMPMPGVSVVVKGTTIGATTNVDGKYELTVPANAQTLTFSFVGFKTQEVAIAGRSVVDVVMQSEAVEMQEVVVTSAYGIKRAPKSTASFAQVVGGEKINEVRQTDVNNAIAGKVSGIQVRSQSAAALNRSGSIRLRGDGGFSTGSGILYVVDGTILPNSSDINMDDVETVTVLSGPSASAILGSQGANGAIIITTKKASVDTKKGIGIDVITGVQASKVYILPRYQNAYAGGSSPDLIRYSWSPNHPVEWQALDGKYYHDYSDDASWGPRMIGQEYIPWYAWYPGTKYSYKTAKLVPQPSNARDFFETGMTTNTSVAFTQATDKINVRAVVGRIDTKGLIYNTSLQKTTFAVKTEYKLTDKFKIGANVNFYTTFTKGEFDDDYSNQSTGSFNQWFHRDLDMKLMKELKDLKAPGGIWASWNHNNPTSYDPADPRGFYAGNYWYNFFKYFELVEIPERNDRLFGDVFLNYEIIKGLNAKVTYRRQQLNWWQEQKYSSDLLESGTQTQGNSPQCKGYYYTGTAYSIRENYETLLSYEKKFNDIKLNANLGTDFFNYLYKSNGAETVNGFSVPNLYAINNSKDNPNVFNTRLQEKYRAAFLSGTLGYKDFLFAEFTYRSDWFSTLPPENNRINSKSFGASFVFSDILKFDFLEFGKIRAAWGEIPQSIGIFAYPGMAYSVEQNKWGPNFLMTTPDTQVDPNIHGAVKSQKELGLEMRFMKNLFGFGVTYWDGTEKDIPYTITVSPYSGYSSRLVNTGEITKKGIDFVLNVRPVSSENYRWEINATLGYLLDNKIVKIAEGIDKFTVQSIWGRNNVPYLVHAKGEQWGQLYGGAIKRINGKPVVDPATGYYVSELKYFGNVLPKVTGGIQNSIRIMKDINVSFNIDYQFGGKFFSLSDMWGTYSGLTEKTAGLNDKGNPIRDPVADGGGVHVTGVAPDGTTPVDMYVEAQQYFHGTYDKAGYYDDYVKDLTFIKLREVSVGYNIPVKKLGLANYVTSANISFVAVNPWLIYAKSKDLDPSEVSYTSGERGQLPGVRSFGFNLKLSF